MSLTRRKFLAFTIAMPILSACSKLPQQSKIPKDSKVIALGDSLTFGYGATPDTAYPAVLAAKTGWDIVNEGVNGDTSEGVLNRLDAVLEASPRLILLGIGGNDVLRKVAPATTTANISQIIDKIKANAITVVLIAEPYFSTSALFGSASDNPIYQTIAAEKNIPLFDKSEGGWSAILSDDSLKSDQIHANAQGYAKFAENLYDFLQEQGFI